MSYLRGVAALIIATVLWGSSFPVIKIVVERIGSFTYTWARSLVAVLILTPYVLIKLARGESKIETVRGGLITGIAYALGLWLQGWGTKYTTASNAAFITGLHVVFVHLYVALFRRKYNLHLFIELLLAVCGLYLLTLPRGGVDIGDILVLLGSIAWAAQVILVSVHGGSSPLLFTYFETMPALLFVMPDLVHVKSILSKFNIDTLLGVLYLALTCTVGAFSLQAYGQKYVPPEVAALIYLLEPVFATVFSWVMLSEHMTMLQLAGSAMILASMVLAVKGLH